MAVDKSQLWLARRSAFISMGIKASLEEATQYGLNMNHIDSITAEVISASADNVLLAQAGYWGRTFNLRETELELAAKTYFLL